MNIDEMVREAQARLAAALDADVARHHKEVAAAFAELRKQLLEEK